MSRFEQRKREALRDPECAEAYARADAEIKFILLQESLGRVYEVDTSTVALVQPQASINYVPMPYVYTNFEIGRPLELRAA